MTLATFDSDEAITVDQSIVLAEARNLDEFEGVEDLVLISQIQWHEDQAGLFQKRSWLHSLQAGRRLAVLRQRKAYGQWEDFVRDVIGISPQHAWDLIQLVSPDNLRRVGDLPSETPVRQVLEVIHEAKREERREARVVERAEKGKVVTPDEALPIDVRMEVGNCASLPMDDESVDLIVTSPPYNLGKDYPNVEDDKAYQVYLVDVERWCVEMHRVAKPRGRICLNIPLDISRGGLQPIYSDWLNCLLDAGWKYKCSVVWNEGNVNKSVARGSIDSPVAPNIFAPVEMIIVCYKETWNLGRGGQHTLGHEEWLSWTNGLWTFPGENRSMYPGAFPEELPKRCITLLSFSDAVVCDPFMGSGTSAVASVRAGRSFYGFDVSEEAVNIARSRLALIAA